MKRIVFLIVAAVYVAGMLAISGCGKERVYTVTFDANGGTGEMKEQIFVKDVSQTLISNAFVREYYSFAGWNTVPDGSDVSYSDAQEVTFSKDVTLYAQWQQSVCKITFDANGGTGSMASMTIEIGEGKYLPENTFIRSGYFFIGWATSTNGKIEYFDKGAIKEIVSDMTLYAQWTRPEGGKQAVDLGLPSGLKWASCNVGADNPEEYGDYFAWGETEPKETYNWSSYTYFDNPTSLPSSADAATANWGSGWRMPTSTEMSELKNNCIVSYGTYNGVNGQFFVGPNGKSIFLPYAGFLANSELHGVSIHGDYWSSSLVSSNFAWNLNFQNGNCMVSYNDLNGHRCYGRSIRPVCQ